MDFTCRRGGGGNPVGVKDSKGGDFFEDLGNRCGGLPLPELARERVIEDDPRKIERARAEVRSWGAGNRSSRKAVGAPVGELAEGHGGGETA